MATPPIAPAPPAPEPLVAPTPGFQHADCLRAPEECRIRVSGTSVNNPAPVEPIYDGWGKLAADAPVDATMHTTDFECATCGAEWSVESSMDATSRMPKINVVTRTAPA